jgi:endoglucanase
MIMYARNLLLWPVFFGLVCAFSSFADIQYAGVNLSGAEFGMTHLPGTFNTDYAYPTSAEVDYYKSKGMNFIRLPFRWERLQHTNSAPLDPTELGRMNAFVSYATSNGIYVLLDPHNFMRYYPSPRSAYQTATVGLVGDYAGSTVSNADFANFWSQIAAIYQTNNHVFFGLNNEPDALPEAELVTSENAAIAAIRATGATNLIFVPGTDYTGAWTWLSDNGSFGAANSVAMLGIVDTGSNYLFEVHQYLDSDGSGTHTNIVNTDIGWQRLTDFTAWARAHNVKGFLGEYAVPGNLFTTNKGGMGGLALNTMLGYIQANSDVWVGWSYWGGGPRWGNNPLFPIEPKNIGTVNQTDQLAMSVIKHFFPLPAPTLQLTNGNQFQYSAPQGFVYQPQFSSDLTSSDNWTNLGPAVTNVPAPTSARLNPPLMVNMTVGPGSQGFYRVQVSHAP